MEWKRKGKKHITKLESKFDGLEWKWNGIGLGNFRERKFVGNVVEMERKQNGNGMEISFTNQVETNFDGMELKWKHSSDNVYMIMYRKWEWSR